MRKPLLDAASAEADARRLRLLLARNGYPHAMHQLAEKAEGEIIIFTQAGQMRDYRIDEVLGIIGLREHAGRPAGILSHGQKQWLEIGMLLMQEPRLLLVDEPVAGMTQQEMDQTAELLTALALRPGYVAELLDTITEIPNCLSSSANESV